MTAPSAPTRRSLLCGVAGTLAGLAGCRGIEESRDDSTTMEPTGGDALDLALTEANVVAVSVTRSDGELTVTVTLFHDDDGEDGYANWWQVETLDGTRIGRRDLTHAHSTDPFSRSAIMPVPAETDCVVVRGHDQTHGYGGQAMLVDLASNTTTAVKQGADPTTFSAADCP